MRALLAALLLAAACGQIHFPRLPLAWSLLGGAWTLPPALLWCGARLSEGWTGRCGCCRDADRRPTAYVFFCLVIRTGSTERGAAGLGAAGFGAVGFAPVGVEDGLLATGDFGAPGFAAGDVDGARGVVGRGVVGVMRPPVPGEPP